MIRRLLRSAITATTLVASTSLPSVANAQLYFTSCSVAGVCGFVEAFFAGNVLNVRISNLDNTIGSALYLTQLTFGSALAAATPGTAVSAPGTASPSGPVTSTGTTSPGGWSFGTVGGSNTLDIASFLNVFIEGPAISPFRAAPGDPDSGTWITQPGGFVEISADVSSISGVVGGQIVGMGFCTVTATDDACASGAAVVTPEPSTVVLLATGFAGLAFVRRRRKSV